MARDSIGTVAAKVTAESSQFQSSMRANTATTQRFGSAAVNANRAAGRSNARFGSSLQQISFAIDDVANSTGDWTQKLRGASNNLSTLAITIHPVAGLLATIGLAALPTVVKQLGLFGEKAKDAKDEAEAFRRELERIEKLEKFRVDIFSGDLGDVTSAAKRAEKDVIALTNTARTIENRRTKLAADLETAQKKSASLFKQAKEAQAGSASNAFEPNPVYAAELTKRARDQAAIAEQLKKQLEVINEKRAATTENLELAKAELKIAEKQRQQLQGIADVIKSAKDAGTAARDFFAAGIEGRREQNLRRQRGRLQFEQGQTGLRIAELQKALEVKPSGELAGLFKKGAADTERELAQQSQRGLRRKEEDEQKKAREELESQTRLLKSQEKRLQEIERKLSEGRLVGSIPTLN